MSRLTEFFKGKGYKPDFDKELAKAVTRYDQNIETDLETFQVLSFTARNQLTLVNETIESFQTSRRNWSSLDEICKKADDLQPYLKKTKLLDPADIKTAGLGIKSIKRQLNALSNYEVLDDPFRTSLIEMGISTVLVSNSQIRRERSEESLDLDIVDALKTYINILKLIIVRVEDFTRKD
ncbi:MAG: hypothetical protein ABI758_01380 [Candidatus Woesebacteria bacterium]